MPSTDKPSMPGLGAKLQGLSLHGAVRGGADQRQQVEHLSRYVTRPAIANERLKRNRAGQVALQLKSSYKDGTTHIVTSPLVSTSASPRWCRIQKYWVNFYTRRSRSYARLRLRRRGDKGRRR